MVEQRCSRRARINDVAYGYKHMRAAHCMGQHVSLWHILQYSYCASLVHLSGWRTLPYAGLRVVGRRRPGLCARWVLYSVSDCCRSLPPWQRQRSLYGVPLCYACLLILPFGWFWRVYSYALAAAAFSGGSSVARWCCVAHGGAPYNQQPQCRFGDGFLSLNGARA